MALAHVCEKQLQAKTFCSQEFQLTINWDDLSCSICLDFPHNDIDGDENIEKDITEDETMEATIRLSSKRVIEQLLMQKTFAREESDRLIHIIDSRIVDHPSVPAAVEGRHNYNGLTSDVNVGEISNTAVMEARKWLEEKKSGSSSKYKATGDGSGSPVDVAKSYMRARLPWGSPGANNSEYRSPPSATVQGISFPYSAGNLSLSKMQMKRKSGSSQSWNIRKVRATQQRKCLKSQ